MLSASVSNTVDRALQYASRGWPIFRLSGKVPLKGSRGFKDATTDLATIERWWGELPNANIGLRTGCGIVVLDIDGAEGLAELKALVAIHGPLPATLTVRTGTGAHAYFAYAGTDIKSSARGALHVRAAGGFVVVPPSVHPNGRRYEWIDPLVTVAELPDWLRTWMQNDKRTDKTGVPLTVASSRPGYLDLLPSRGLAGAALQAIKTAESTWSPQEQKRIESALKAIPADNYEIWYKIGMILQGLQWIGGDGIDYGLELWDQWSQGCEAKYPGIEGVEAKWSTFGAGGRRARTREPVRAGPGSWVAGGRGRESGQQS